MHLPHANPLLLQVRCRDSSAKVVQGSPYDASERCRSAVSLTKAPHVSGCEGVDDGSLISEYRVNPGQGPAGSLRATSALELRVRQQANTGFLFALAALALYLSYLVAEPFLNAIFAAVVLAVVFQPLHAKMHFSVRRPNLAATVSTTLVILVVAIPAIVLGVVASKELGDLYRSLNEKSAAQGGVSAYLMHLLEMPVRLLGRYIDLSRVDFRSTLLGWVDGASRFLVGVSGRAVSNLLSLILEVVVVFFTLFFLFRDGNWIQRRVGSVLPLTAEQSTRLVSRVSETIVASVHGGIAVGVAQGLLTGIALWVLGLSSPVLWGLVAALASLIPLVGTGLVWVPATAVLAVDGHWIKALILLAWGAGVVAQIDAVVRPYIISGRAKMHNLLIFFALLGGVKAFGFIGLFMGPVIVSVTIVLLDMLREVNAVPAPTERPITSIE
jgi:predicted PurR-regulated permease PerM